MFQKNLNQIFDYWNLPSRDKSIINPYKQLCIHYLMKSNLLGELWSLYFNKSSSDSLPVGLEVVEGDSSGSDGVLVFVRIDTWDKSLIQVHFYSFLISM